jgi:pimeloyl-ACP methyl ester carboxylesterase
MLRLSIGRLTSLLCLALAFHVHPPVARAQADVDKQNFVTFDGVTIQCDWYTGSKGTKAPVVMLLHKIGGNRKQMSSIAEKLQEAGYAVANFDFRGHGDSTRVDDKLFWKARANKNGVRPGTRLDTIDMKSFAPAYMPYLVQDIAACKYWLEQKNNDRQCNVNDVVIIGAEDGATLGALFTYTEWDRRRTTVDLMTGVPKTGDPEGKDIAALITLSIKSSIGKQPMYIDSWFTKFPVVREKVGFCFMYGAEDKAGEKQSLHLFGKVLGGDDPKNKPKLTYKLALPGTKAAGHELLKVDELKTEDKIVDYLKKVVFDSRNTKVWDSRELKTFPLIEVPLQRYGIQVP